MDSNSSGIEQYSSRFLPEVKQAIKALDHEVRLAVVSALEQHGDLSFSELRRLLKISKSDFYYHLKQLMMGGIIKSYSREKMEISPYTSYYGLTELGKSFTTALSRALLPPSLLEHIVGPVELTWKKMDHYVQVPEVLVAPEVKIRGKERLAMYLQQLHKGKGIQFSRVHAEKGKMRVIAVSGVERRKTMIEGAKW